MERFQGMSAVVTGASSGVGRAIALALSSEGATVALVGRDAARLEAVAREARSKTLVLTAEFCDPDALDQLGGALARSFDSLDALVHCAGTIKLAPFASASLEDLDMHYRCNARAPYALTQRLLPALARAKGSIVFMNSTAIDHPRAGLSQYAASKQALKAIADNVRQEVNRDGVRVLTVLLGRTATPMQEAIHREERRAYDPASFIQPRDVAELVLDALASSHTVELTDLTLRPVLPLP